MWKLIKTGEDKMTNDIPGVGINTRLVSTYTGQPSGNAPTPEGTDNNPTPTAAGYTPVDPDSVFTFLSYNPTVNTPRTYDVSKYVTPEQATRIAALVASFEGEVAQGLLRIEEELPNLPEDVKLTIAAGMVQ